MPPSQVNPMMQALQQSRQQNPVSSSGLVPGGPPQPTPDQGGDMAKYWSMMQDMNSKLDKLIEAISSAYTGKTPQPDEDGKDDSKHGSDGY